MSEPPTKRPSTLVEKPPPCRPWRTGTSKRYWDAIEAGEFAHARAIIDEGCTHQDSEALYERARLLHVDNEPTQARAAYFQSTMLGHPEAFVYLAHLGQLSHAIGVVSGCDSKKWSSKHRFAWAQDYLESAGSAIALWTWHVFFLRNATTIPFHLLFDAAQQENTPHVAFLQTMNHRDYVLSARRNHREACYIHAGQGYGYRGGPGQSMESILVPRNERTALLRVSAAQGYRPAILDLAIQGFAGPPPQRWQSAKMLVDLAASIQEDRDTMTRIDFIMAKRVCFPTVQVVDYPRAFLHETAYYCEFLRKHMVVQTDDSHEWRHTLDCSFCGVGGTRYGPVGFRNLGLSMLTHAKRRASAYAASLALLCTLRRRNRWNMPRDISIILAQQVWASRLDAPHAWTPEDMEQPPWKMTENDERSAISSYRMLMPNRAYARGPPVLDPEPEPDPDKDWETVLPYFDNDE
jgi:hypothetical protein